MIEGKDSHDARSFATKAWRGEPISTDSFCQNVRGFLATD
jgi:hypothetical protein